MIPALQECLRKPICDLTDAEHYVIAMNGYMCDIRMEANRQRMIRWKNHSHMSYLIGRLHGYKFGMTSALVFRHSPGYYEELGDWADGLITEANFLGGEYLADSQ